MESKQKVERCERAEIYLSALCENTTDYILFSDSEGRALLFNDAYADMIHASLGIRMEVGMQPYKRLPAGDREYWEGLHKRARSGERFVAEYSHPMSNGDLRHFQLHFFPIYDQERIIGFAEFSRDITSQLLYGSEYLKNQKLESVGTMAGGIAHDFNNILMSIFNAIELVSMDLEPDSEARTYLGYAEKSCRKAVSLTQQLLTFSRGGDPVKKSFDLKKSIELARSIVMGEDKPCRLDIAKDLWPLEADGNQIEQVFISLLKNAKQATLRGGEISVAAQNAVVNAGKNSAPTLAPGKYVKITVIDGGEGIAEADLPRVFDPYFTTHPSHTGMGLATCYSIIRKHRGVILCQRQTGNGTVVTFYLPTLEKRIETAATGNANALKDRKILIMDDDDVVRNMMALMLKKVGFPCDCAEEGGRALEMYRKAMETGHPYSAVILDLMVPFGMGGKETAQRILKIDPNAKVIISSGYSNDPIMAHPAKHGFIDCLMKPYSIHDLEISLNRAIEKAN